MQALRIMVAAVVGLSAACGCTAKPAPVPKTVGLPDLRPVADAPYDLADETDLQLVRGRYEALAADDSERITLRRELAEEYTRRIGAGLAQPDRRYSAYEALVELAGLWEPRALVNGAPGMAAYRDSARAVHTSFARSGGDIEAATALFFLATASPDQQAEYTAEIATIFAYADELAVSQYGNGAEHARPIEILEAVVAALPTPEVVDRLVARYINRQESLASHLRRQAPREQLLRAHGAGVFRTTWNIVRVLARSERLDEAPAAIGNIKGLGDDEKLREILRIALDGSGGAESWIVLAAAFHNENPQLADPVAALRVCLEGSRRYPGNAELYAAAGATARQLERNALAIALYERSLALDPNHRDVTEALADLYRNRVGMLVFTERPQTARAHLKKLEAFHARAATRWPDEPLEVDLAQTYAAMGRGLVGLGELDEAAQYLHRSLSLRANHDALEYLGTIALKQDRFADAHDAFERALKMPADDVVAQFARAKILRLDGDAMAGLEAPEEAQKRWNDTIAAWTELAQNYELPPRFQGELLIELAKAHWALGDRDRALRLFEAAVDTDSDGADTHTSVVSFLITRGHYQRALDTFHRALGSHEISDYAKVYMSLWVMAEARRQGIAADPLARDYLAGRSGRLWYDELARFATGRAALSDLVNRATTRGRRAELWYYAAVLPQVDTAQSHAAPASANPAGSSPVTAPTSSHDEAEVRRLLRSVLATDMVLFFEYEMAKYWLTEGANRLHDPSRP